MNIKGIHPLAAMFPLLSDAEMEDLAADISQNGQHFAISVTEDGFVLDGQNRYRACEMAGIEPKVEVVNPDDLVAFVISRNISRRNLSPERRATIVAALAVEAGKHSVYRSTANDALGEDTVFKRNSDDSVRSRAREANVSVSTQHRADTLVAQHPEAAKAVIDGKKTITEAKREAEAAKAPPKPEAPAPPTDCYGVPIPPVLAEIFNDETHELILASRRMISAIEKTFEEVLASPLEIYFARSQARDAIRVLRDCVGPRNLEPHCVCPVCGGDSATKSYRKCQYCKQRGWVTKTAFDLIPHEFTGTLKAG